MPGLIDMHVHIEKETGPGKYLEAFTMNNAREAVRQPYKNSADWIKVTETGGVLSMARVERALNSPRKRSG